MLGVRWPREADSDRKSLLANISVPRDRHCNAAQEVALLDKQGVCKSIHSSALQRHSQASLQVPTAEQHLKPPAIAALPTPAALVNLPLNSTTHLQSVLAAEQLPCTGPHHGRASLPPAICYSSWTPVLPGPYLTGASLRPPSC